MSNERDEFINRMREQIKEMETKIVQEMATVVSMDNVVSLSAYRAKKNFKAAGGMPVVELPLGPVPRVIKAKDKEPTE